MVNIGGFARLGTIAVGLGIGAAMAHSPVASADTSTDWLSAVDTLLGGGALPGLVASPLDYQISFDGYDLFPTTGNLATATTTAGDYGLAIAFGDGADAESGGGIGNVAIDIGNNTGESDEVIAGDGNGNIAIDIGNNSGESDQIVADEGNSNVVMDIGNNSGLSDQMVADEGNSNVAIHLGDYDGTSNGVDADEGNNNFAEAIGTDNSAFADEGNNNFAEVIGPENSSAGAFDGSHDISYVLDPFGTTASSAYSGDSNFDLAAVLLTDGSATAQGSSDYLYDIISALGNESGALPASLATLLTELSTLF
jgi:hypothetical protein